MSVSQEDKTDISDINQRFLHYVNKVRQLKNEDDISIINQSITILEEELKILKSSYESQIFQLKTTLDVILTQKLEIEQDLLLQKTNECHLNEKLTLESSTNSKLLHELSNLRSDISSDEQEIISLNLIIKQLRIERADMEEKFSKLILNVQENNEKNLKFEGKICEYENQITCLKQKIDFQNQFLSQVNYLQEQLESEISENNKLKQNNDFINVQLLEMTKNEAELNSIIESQKRRIDILEKTLIEENHGSEKIIYSLQNKVRELQQHITIEIDQARNGSNSSNLSIRGEIEFIKRLLTEEEKRLNIGSGFQVNETERSDLQNNNIRNEDKDINVDMKLGHNESKAALNISTGYVGSQDKIIDSEFIDYVSEEEDMGQINNRYINNLSTEENNAYESPSIGLKLDNTTYFVKENKNINESNENREFSDCQNNQFVSCWPNTNTTIVKPHIPVGPLSHLESPIGPVRPISSTPYPKNERPPRPLSANLLNIRTRSCTSQHEPVNKDCLSRNSNNFSDSGIGQSPDYFDSLFKSKERSEEFCQSNINNQYEANLSLIKIIEVNKDGKYIKLWNSSDKHDAEIGNYTLRQNKFGRLYSIFRFPDQIKFPSKGTATIWSGSNDPKLHQPPNNFYSSQPYLWGSGSEFTTILCNAQDQVLSWTSTPNRINLDPCQSNVVSIVNNDKKKDFEQKLPELIPNNITVNHEQIYLIRNESELLPEPIHQLSTNRSKQTANHQSIEDLRDKKSDNFLTRQIRKQDNIISVVNAKRLSINSAKVLPYYYPIPTKYNYNADNRTAEVIFHSYDPSNGFQRPNSRPFMNGSNQLKHLNNGFNGTKVQNTNFSSKQ